MAYTGPVPFPVVEGGTGDASFTAYSIICAGTTSTGALQNVSGVGTSGQVLTSNGAAALPTWAANGSGSLVLIQTQTVSNVASLAFTSGLTAYNTLFLLSENVQPVTDSVTLLLKYSTNGGSSYLATNYTAGMTSFNFNNATGANLNASTYTILIGNLRNNTHAVGNGVTYISGITSSGVTMDWSLFTNYSDDGGANSPFQVLSAGVNSTTNQVNAIQISCSSGNINKGTFTLYGILV